MTDEVERTPVRKRMPWCYTMHRGDADCAACPHQTACARATENNAERLTVRQAADAAIAAYRAGRGDSVPDAIDLARIVAEVSGMKNEHAVARLTADHEWHQAFRVVLAVCARAGWEPRTYVRAISETVGRWAVSKGWMVRPGMFVGASATARFERWVERNRRKHNDAQEDRRADPEREALLAGECCFAERLVLSRSVTLADAAAYACSVFPSWSLDKTEGRDDLRLPALAGALASIEAGLPHRVLAPSGPWSWADVRDELHSLIRLPEDHDDEEVLELSPHLGELM